MAQGQKNFYFLLGGIALVGVIWLGLKLKGGATPVSTPANIVIAPLDTAGFHGYTLGSDSARIDVVEYGDLECAGCQQWALVQFPDVHTRLITTGKIRLIFRDFPIDGKHPHPRVAATAAACANDQGRYWEMSHEIFQNLVEISKTSTPIPLFREAAKRAGVDADKWSACMEAHPYDGRIQASLEEGEKLGVEYTPSFLIGGQLYTGLSSDQMVRIVDSLLAAKPVGKP